MYAYDIGCLDGINIFVMWAGTDLTGGVANYLQTVSQSIYKLRMLP